MSGGNRYANAAPQTTGSEPGKPIDLGPMPTWNLADLYAGPNSKAVQADLEKAAGEAQRMRQRYQGKLAALGGNGAALAEAIAAYEALSETIGKLGSYAGLLYAGDTSNPENAKFYGDIQDRLTTITTDLIFFELELNKIEDAPLAQALDVPALAHYRPWIADLRKDKPYQLEEQLERLFHEKAITSHSAWGRLFSETMTALRFEMEGEKAPLALEPTLNFLMSPDEGKRRAAAQALAKVFKDNGRLFTLVTNTLAKDKEISDRWRGFKDVADSRHLGNRVEAPVVNALVKSVRDAYTPFASLLQDEGEVARQGAARTLGPQRAAAQGRAAHDSVGRSARDRAHRLRRLLTQDGGGRRPLLRP